MDNIPMAIVFQPSQTTPEVQHSIDFMNNNGINANELYNLFNLYEIPVGILSKIHVLSEYDIYFILDDSGSMNTFSNNISRFQELKERVLMMLDILQYFNVNITITFLNRQDILNSKSPDFMKQLNIIFNMQPMGPTPIKKALQNVFRNKNKTVIYLFTDGSPTDCTLYEIQNIIRNRNAHQFPLTLLSCTEDDNEVAWMKEIDKTCSFVAEIDDFETCKKEFQEIHGKFFPYTKGLWIISNILSSIDQDLDDLNEKPLNKKGLEKLIGRQISKEEFDNYWNNCPHNKKNSYCIIS